MTLSAAAPRACDDAIDAYLSLERQALVLRVRRILAGQPPPERDPERDALAAEATRVWRTLSRTQRRHADAKAESPPHRHREPGVEGSAPDAALTVRVRRCRAGLVLSLATSSARRPRPYPWTHCDTVTPDWDHLRGRIVSPRAALVRCALSVLGESRDSDTPVGRVAFLDYETGELLGAVDADIVRHEPAHVDASRPLVYVSEYSRGFMHVRPRALAILASDANPLRWTIGVAACVGPRVAAIPGDLGPTAFASAMTWEYLRTHAHEERAGPGGRKDDVWRVMYSRTGPVGSYLVPIAALRRILPKRIRILRLRHDGLVVANGDRAEVCRLAARRAPTMAERRREVFR